MAADGRLVVVTGAAGALGTAVVRSFVAAGERVLAADRDEGALAKLAEAVGGGGVETAALDLADPAAVAAVFDRAESLGGPPAVVAHVVGGFRAAPLARTSDADWRFLVTVNLETTFLVMREAARRFERAGGGALVAVAAPAGLLGEAGVGAYAASKAAVLRLVESLAREMAPFGGRANAVLPGTMDTPANRAAMPRADTSRWVSTDAVAEAIRWLASPAAHAINGAAVPVPGPSLG